MTAPAPDHGPDRPRREEVVVPGSAEYWRKRCHQAWAEGDQDKGRIWELLDDRDRLSTALRAMARRCVGIRRDSMGMRRAAEFAASYQAATIARLRGDRDELQVERADLRARLAEVEAECARLLDLACACESGLGGCAAHQIPHPPPCRCGHQKALHDPGCLCAWGRGIDCGCESYEAPVPPAPEDED